MRSCEDRGLYHGDKLKAVFEERSDTVGTNTMVFLKIEKTDREVDDLVYKLYGITDDEKHLIEGEIDKKK